MLEFGQGANFFGARTSPASVISDLVSVSGPQQHYIRFYVITNYIISEVNLMYTFEIELGGTTQKIT